jgi:hypothetical protein
MNSLSEGDDSMKQLFALSVLICILSIWFYGKEQVEKRSSSLVPKLVSNKTHVSKTSLKSVDQKEALKEISISAAELYQAGRLSRSCVGVPLSDAELNDWVTQAYQDNEPFEYVNDMQERFEICASNHIVKEPYIDLLMQAAKKGSDKAILELWAIGDVEFAIQPSSYNKDPSEYTPSTLELFKVERYQLANSLALTGGEHALLTLIKAYQHYDPETKRQNLVKSLAYAEFAINVLDKGDIYQKAFWFKNKLTKQLKYEDTLKAQLLTNELIEKYHKRS